MSKDKDITWEPPIIDLEAAEQEESEIDEPTLEEELAEKESIETETEEEEESSESEADSLYKPSEADTEPGSDSSAPDPEAETQEMGNDTEPEDAPHTEEEDSEDEWPITLDTYLSKHLEKKYKTKIQNQYEQVLEASRDNWPSGQSTSLKVSKWLHIVQKPKNRKKGFQLLAQELERVLLEKKNKRKNESGSSASTSRSDSEVSQPGPSKKAKTLPAEPEPTAETSKETKKSQKTSKNPVAPVSVSTSPPAASFMPGVEFGANIAPVAPTAPTTATAATIIPPTASLITQQPIMHTVVVPAQTIDQFHVETGVASTSQVVRATGDPSWDFRVPLDPQKVATAAHDNTPEVKAIANGKQIGPNTFWGIFSKSWKRKEGPPAKYYILKIMREYYKKGDGEPNSFSFDAPLTEAREAWRQLGDLLDEFELDHPEIPTDKQLPTGLENPST